MIGTCSKFELPNSRGYRLGCDVRAKRRPRDWHRTWWVYREWIAQALSLPITSEVAVYSLTEINLRWLIAWNSNVHRTLAFHIVTVSVILYHFVDTRGFAPVGLLGCALWSSFTCCCKPISATTPCSQPLCEGLRSSVTHGICIPAEASAASLTHSWTHLWF